MTRTSESVPSTQQRLRRIEGRHNALVKELRQAFMRAERTEDGNCAIEGLRIAEEAIRSGLRFRAIFFKESAQNMAERLLPQIGANVDTLLPHLAAFCRIMVGFAVELNRTCSEIEKGAPCAPRS